MNHGIIFAFIGGDLRQIPVIRLLSEEGHEIKTFCLEQAEFPNHPITPSKTLEEALNDADVVVLPLPYSLDGKTVHAKLSSQFLPVQDVICAMKPNQLLLAGRGSEYLSALCELHHIRLVDYTKREELLVLNAVPTVEGALAIAMEKTPYTIHQSQCLVLGYGRIGKLLSGSLQGLGAKVRVAARKHSDLAWMKAYGISGVPMENLADAVTDCNIIFNTVPHLLLDFPILAKIPKSYLIIDLASGTGGVDFETARELGRTAIHALSLPGKVAPETAGVIIKDTIVNILEELGV